MKFPKTLKEFVNRFSFKDSKEVYTNGAELVPVFRVEQAFEHYEKEIREKAIDDFAKEIRDWQIDIQDNEYDANKIDFVFERIFEIAEEIKAVWNE